MNKITTLAIFTMILALSSCGQTGNQVVDITDPNPGETEGVMIENSSTIILDDTSKVIEGKAENEPFETTDGPL